MHSGVKHLAQGQNGTCDLSKLPVHGSALAGNEPATCTLADLILKLYLKKQSLHLDCNNCIEIHDVYFI